MTRQPRFQALLLLLLPALGQAAEFAKGGDVGWLPQMEASGYVFRGDDGNPEDCLRILRQHGIDTLRLRVFVNPSEHPRSGHCGSAEVAALAARGRRMGFRILLDFHYSDSWADPGKQTKPAAWEKLTFEQLATAVFDHTRDVLAELKTAGVTPEWVQVGNEIPNGMLWPEGRPENGRKLAELINAGYRAVKAADPGIKVIVHLDRGNEGALYRGFFDALEQNGARYDVIGMSYYPFWQKVDYTQTLDDLGRNLDDMAKRYGKDVMVVEIGGEDHQPENTRDMLAAVLKRVHEVPEKRGLGVVYWEPQGAASWSKYKLSCWGDDGRPTVALDAFLEGGGGK
ncbi:glycosyl hydrolase 53 family protein [bacterium]|nr:glycosyl hydrolase 53 family protein [bacterium]